MKKIILAAVAVFAFGIVNAQKREKGTIEVAPAIGYSTSTYSGDNAAGLERVTGTNFGVSGDYFFNDRWSIRSGISSETMGARSIGQEVKLNYIMIPINANWHFGSNRKWNLNFGISTGFLSSAKYNGTDETQYYNSNQFGISYGIGYKIEVSDKISILIDDQEFFGTSKIYKESASTLQRSNVSGSLRLGVVFHF